MPEQDGQWQDWTSEGYAERSEWHDYVAQQLQEQLDGAPSAAHDMIRKRFKELLAAGPAEGSAFLEQLNRRGREGFISTPSMDELGDVPEMAPPSMDMLRRYQLGAMDVPARAAALQSGAASQRLGGLNPSARAQALSEVSRGGSGMVGTGAGWGGMAQQAALSSYQGQMQNRGMLGNTIQQAIGQGYAMDQIGLQHRNAQEMMRMQYDMQRKQRQRGGGFWGALGGIAGAAMGGPFGGAVGNWFGNQFSGGRGQYDYSSPMGGQQHQYVSPGYGR